MIPNSEKLDLLIVGAEPFTRALFQSAAEECGCFAEPTFAEDGFDAMASLWDLCEINRLPDVVVADFDLPALNAIQLTHEIRRHAETRRVFVAILSTTPAEMDRVAGETAGADYFENYRAAGADLREKFQEIGRMICRANPVSR